MTVVHLSLVSHTNIGKTTLARTLLRRDIGEVRDAPHVTEAAEGHELVRSAEGDELRLWDTPGFGDSSRLLKRLHASGNPIGWLLTQVWDRFTDRPFFSSQQAARNVHEKSDVVLYLVNAAEDPAVAGYVDAEMAILDWLGKPVVLLLNQVGATGTDAADEAAWLRHLQSHPQVKAALSLDAFARCWVQEDELLRVLSSLDLPDKTDAAARLRQAWRERNLSVFDQSMQALARQLAAAAADRTQVPDPTWKARVSGWLASMVAGKERADPEVERAMRALAQRLDESVRATTAHLLELHGLSGRASAQVLARAAGQFNVREALDAAKAGALGGFLTGAFGGLAADLAAGGLTFGAGALIGGVLGALGGTGAAHAYRALRGADEGSVGWSADFLTARVTAALMRYLTVAHFGRGRGEWVEEEAPRHWRPLVEEAVARATPELQRLWALNDAQAIEDPLRLTLAELAREVLRKLYPRTTVFD